MEKTYEGGEGADKTKEKSKDERERSKTFGARNKKQMYIKLKNQMEFYFSPSNIARDKFVGKLLQESPKIPVSTFLTFNKVKEIFAANMIAEEKQHNELAKALTKSELLQVTEDNAEVFLKKELQKKTPQEIDELTVYAEHIPLGSTHDSLKNIFSKYGKVNYISLPRYKRSGQIKQFCFIEFDDAASVQNVLQGFKKFDALLPHQSIKPENLLSIKTFEKDQHGEEDADESRPPPAKKQKLSTPASSTDNEPNDEKSEQEGEEEEEEGAPTAEKSNEESGGDTEKKADDAGKKKKLRKHKRNHSKKKLLDERLMVMKVMKKTEWKKLRNTYLTLERQKAKEIKKILRESYNKRNESKNPPMLTATSKASPKISFYGSPDHFTEHPNESSPNESQQVGSAQNNFTLGCIVNIKFREQGCVDFKEFKKELKQFPCVQYVDIPEGGAQCFIRVDAPQASHELLSHYSSCEYETEILKDEIEKEYWKKIFDNRERKKKKSQDNEKQPPEEQKRKRKRGREKLSIKIAKVTQSNQIIRFSDHAEDHAE